MLKKTIIYSIFLPIILFGCKNKTENKTSSEKANKMTNKIIENKKAVQKIDKNSLKNIISQLVKKYGSENKNRITKGVNQISKLWNIDIDGNKEKFKSFCMKNFYGDSTKLEKLFKRFERNWEIISGNNTKIKLDLNVPIHVEIGEKLPIDKLFGGYSPFAHIIEDMYRSKIGFIIALNFPNYSLSEKNSSGKNWSSLDWAYARMGDLFTSRIPAKIKQNISKAMTESDDYISNYNIYVGFLIDDNFKTYFPKDKKLITHWNLRDELKSQYANKKLGLHNQKMIYQVMKRIIDQSIPQKVINKNNFLWNPESNKLYKDKKEIKFTPEPDTRYEYFLKNFLAQKAVDKYSPQYPTYINRAFDRDLEYSAEEIEKLFINLVSSNHVKSIGKLISKRLGRKLEPFDIWYNGFKSKSSISEKELNKIISKKYKKPLDFQNDLVKILKKLGFKGKTAKFITSKIKVDPSRGAGHAYGAEMKSDVSHLRTRFGKNGMDYKGYNIAIHEFGHNVEQTFTLHNVKHYMIHGVPNTAFTEAWAFVFQKRDLELLGKTKSKPNKKHLMALDNFWSSYEIMGVSLVDINVWRWLYKNPECNKKQLKEAVIKIAKDIWNKYYAPVFQIKDQTILAVYSHMIDYPLYLPAYPIGHLAEFQIEQFINGKNLGKEMERICSQGRLTPDLWMKGAVNSKLSVEPTLKATGEALKHIK
jgi:hypothetical protein